MDIGNSAATLDKASKKKAIDLSKKFYAKVLPWAMSDTMQCDSAVYVGWLSAYHARALHPPTVLLTCWRPLHLCSFWLPVSSNVHVISYIVYMRCGRSTTLTSPSGRRAPRRQPPHMPPPSQLWRRPWPPWAEPWSSFTSCDWLALSLVQ
jgi:hypothetical protein